MYVQAMLLLSFSHEIYFLRYRTSTLTWKAGENPSIIYRHAYTCEKHQQSSSKHWAELIWITRFHGISMSIIPSNHLHFVSDVLVSQSGGYPMVSLPPPALVLQGTWGHGHQRWKREAISRLPPPPERAWLVGPTSNQYGVVLNAH